MAVSYYLYFGFWCKYIASLKLTMNSLVDIKWIAGILGS